MTRPVMKEEWRGKPDKMILLCDLSRILGKSRKFLADRYYKKTPCGVMKLDGKLYVYLAFAKTLAKSYAVFSDKPIDQILQEIDSYTP